LAQGLREAGHAVDAVADGKRGLIHAQTTDYDVIVLDWMLPEIDGLTVLFRIREKGVGAAVIMLTAKDALDDKVLALTHGADDYLVKPFAFKELLARVHALGRRRHGQLAPVIRVGPLSIDSSTKTAAVRNQPLTLAPREYALLEYLALRLGRPVSRRELEEHLYDDRSQILSNAIDATVYSLRTAMKAAGCPPLIHTRRKLGYVLQDPETGVMDVNRAG
jgi:two-component system copper resistance phosphate regulon response regulator CusR